jgi:protoporphyrinogen oxidase
VNGKDELPNVVIIGAGPAGLTAAFRLVERGVPPTILEASQEVGGLARTFHRGDWHFDAGGHRFFTKDSTVESIWRDLLGEDLLRRERRSAFLVNKRFHRYPLQPWRAIWQMAPLQGILCATSFALARLHPPPNQDNFEEWALARFGKRLYRLLYKPYSEKVWGLPAREISAAWAAQRIKVPAGILALLRGLVSRSSSESLVHEFWYPRLGPGMMWDEMYRRVQAGGAKVLCGAKVTSVQHEAGRVVAVRASSHGGTTPRKVDHLLSSMPLGALVQALDPAAPPDVMAAARSLRHRNLLVVALVVPERVGFPYNWVYLPSPSTRVGRIQNYRRWSDDLVRDGLTALGLEYFLAEDDPLWKMSDEDVKAFAKRELVSSGLAKPDDLQEGYVLRVPQAYPVHDRAFESAVSKIRAWLEVNVSNLQPVGRNGMHKYNNQDHSMLTAMLAVENLFGASHDVWAVNTRSEYHEERPADRSRAQDAAHEAWSARYARSYSSDRTWNARIDGQDDGYSLGEQSWQLAKELPQRQPSAPV